MGMVYALTLCILMDFPIQIDTTSMGLSILHFKRSLVEFSKFWCISVLEVVGEPEIQKLEKSGRKVAEF